MTNEYSPKNKPSFLSTKPYLYLLVLSFLLICGFGYCSLHHGIMINLRAHSSLENLNTQSIFQFTVESITGGKKDDPIPLSNYRGKKAYLVVNVASK